MGAVTMRADVERFLDWLRIERRYSPNTVQGYARSLVRLEAHAQALGLSRWEDLRGAQL
ncbi:MAG: site-specific integrase, partial [Dokdonella sp.]|nr:site-specific integrase [Dokdonella sp.]